MFKAQAIQGASRDLYHLPRVLTHPSGLIFSSQFHTTSGCSLKQYNAIIWSIYVSVKQYTHKLVQREQKGSSDWRKIHLRPGEGTETVMVG